MTREGRAKLTAIIQIKRPFRSGRPLALKFGLSFVHIPAYVAEDLVVLLLGEGVDAGDLLDLPRLEYADEDLQDVDRLEAQPRLGGSRGGLCQRDCNIAKSDTRRASAASPPYC